MEDMHVRVRLATPALIFVHSLALLLITINSATWYSVMPPHRATLWVFSTFGEDDRKITKKAQTSVPAARAECLRPYKSSEISNRLAGLRANEQYHQMCGRPNVMPPPQRSAAVDLIEGRS
jgi:hypothetical protein